MDGRDGPCRRASAALMCLAGDGGGKGSRSSRLAGVVGAEPGAGDLRGDAADEPKRWCAGLGLGVENGKKGDDAQCCFFPGVAVTEARPSGGGVAGAACGGEVSGSCVSGFAWHPPMSPQRAEMRKVARRRAGSGLAGAFAELGGWGGHGGKREERERVASGDCGGVKRIETGKVGEE